MWCSKSLLVIFSFLVIIISVSVYNIFIKKELSPVISLKNGKVQGIVMTSREGREFYAYLGIPFAKPPIGSLRFETPIPAGSWDGIWDGTFCRPMCAQFDFLVSRFKSGSEDCLYLNLFVPKNIPQDTKLPVLAYIHGGYFHMGGTITGQPHKFMDHDVIIISLAYRLGSLGFLNTGDGIVRGNMGLKDQNLGLKWIQENIKEFGGDATRVTLLGESAGGASVQFHMLSPASKGLFSRAIRESGSALNFWTVYRNSKKQAQRFANRFKCPIDNTETMVACLKSTDLQTLLEGHRDLQEYPLLLIDKFSPSIETVIDENSFQTEEPLDLLKRGKFNKVPVLSGFCANEGLMMSMNLWANQTKYDQVDDWFAWAPRAFHYDPSLRKISQKLKEFYFGTHAVNFNNLTNIYTDRYFALGIAQSALLERKHIPTYLYLYEHEGGFNSGNVAVAASQSRIHPIVAVMMERIQFLWVTLILGKTYKHAVPGTSHADELPMLWGGPVEDFILLTSKDGEYSKTLVQLWVDFASDRTPLKFQGVDFIPSNGNDELKYLKINFTDPQMIKDPFRDRRIFWEKAISIPSE